MEVLDWFFTNRSKHTLTMQLLYKILDISRQGFHKHRNKRQAQLQKELQIVDRVVELRQDHPRMGARPLYLVMQRKESDLQLLKGIGRDKFEQILLANGLRVDPIRIFHKTTYSGAFRFPNLVEGLEIQDINRIWISDLTYYRLLDGWAYLTFILDLYSRRCLGYALSQVMQTEQTTIPALNMALDTRLIKDYKHKLLLHADGGGQYYDKEFLKITKLYNIDSSMAHIVYENPHMERFHSTIKNKYLIPWGVNSVAKLRKQLPRSIQLYNMAKPHQSLKGKTPIEFEQYVQQIPLCQRPSVLFKKVT